ncbi:PUA-like domain-containing protein [Lentinula edodes]|uniref:PUA-like domain-containing protein n=1 Tax=Lentinula edodes TaxID=5353 RepID=UPI001E8E46E8|nr:PUA-like domain-containing protein [Lentinula edodes]KAH7880694.1 PUA-like domain-containing protein [Lentinula edodes]KAJ3902105.1 PUA-like domain-containing protein [Lentinula edodes]
MSAYEKQRLANIAKNKKLLEELGLNKPFFEPVEKPRKPQATAKKRKIEQIEDNDSPQKKSSRTLDASSDRQNSTLRRSTRNSGKAIDYSAEIISEDYIPDSFKAGIRVTKNTGPLGREDGKRVHDPKKFGAIPGIEVGTWWESRQGCSADSIHAPWVAGISGGPEGAYSVALSGGYDDDIDDGYAFTYTGSGGRDLRGTKTAPKNLRTAPQSSDQSFDHSFNAALKKSAETKKPVRVIRGFKSTSNYAPTEGYRYDGLYTVESAWMQKGLNPKGYLVCKYLFKRLPDQPPIPVRMSGGD